MVKYHTSFGLSTIITYYAKLETPINIRSVKCPRWLDKVRLGKVNVINILILFLPFRPTVNEFQSLRINQFRRVLGISGNIYIYSYIDYICVQIYKSCGITLFWVAIVVNTHQSLMSPCRPYKSIHSRTWTSERSFVSMRCFILWMIIFECGHTVFVFIVECGLVVFVCWSGT